MEDELNTDLVRCSRAGDVFHYRWAARRCLKMIHPSSQVNKIVIEGSQERTMAGEYVIDVAEYLKEDENGYLSVNYFQLKHTTVLKNKPFYLGDLKKTLIGFSKRYTDLTKKKDERRVVNFYIVTNRPISKKIKINILKLQKDEECDKKFLTDFEKYTGLLGREMTSFCKCVFFLDGLGDYSEQLQDLYIETSQLLAGTVDSPQIDNITALVSEKALPNSTGEIYPQDILMRFGCTSERDMYPAPPEFEITNDLVPREQYRVLSEIIMKSQNAIIIHAAGGVGKSIFASEIQRLLINESIAIIYDSFGAGKYRNRSQPRHRYRDGLIQIGNELAIKGLCDPIIVQSGALDDQILRKFLFRLQTSIVNLKNINPNAQLLIVIDAADNAEMAAKDIGETCFAHELLREKFPEDCHLVMLCRTERIELLDPEITVERHELLAFSEQESFCYLKKHCPQATEADGLEFFRLTNGNPRIQANALAIKSREVSAVLSVLGPKGTTVEKQIENQLDLSVRKIKEKLTGDYHKQIDAICTGLAILPPYIPINILATVAEVEAATVSSFISDLGRPIWISDSVVQFRDEPTETWFRHRFIGTKQQIEKYIVLLIPMATQFTYVAEILPSLFMQAEQYSQLVELTLSNDCLPQNNPIDRRNVQASRLQFAFKSALRIRNYSDAFKIAMLAGEEMAGDKRQLEIFKNNVDLISPLQDTNKVQEIAFKKILRGNWEGSENIFSAALLSTVPEFHGEARSYLRAAENWLQIYFERKKEDKFYHNKLKNEEITEMAFAYYNLCGINTSVQFVLNLRPYQVLYHVACGLVKRLIDLNQLEKIEEMAALGIKNVYFIISLTYELLLVGKYLDSKVLEYSLEVLSNATLSFPKIENSYEDTILSAVMSFIEVCAIHRMASEKIDKVINFYFPSRVTVNFESHFKNQFRNIFLRKISLIKLLHPNIDIDIAELLPMKTDKDKDVYQKEQENKSYRELLTGLLPCYAARISILTSDSDILDTVIQAAQLCEKRNLHSVYRGNEIIGYEIAQTCVDILLFSRKSTSDQVKKFFSDNIISTKTILMSSRLQALRGANRLSHLFSIKNEIDAYVQDAIESVKNEVEIMTIAEYYIDLARATISVSQEDASAYFNMAIEIVSRFGDEIAYRWQAIAELAKRNCDENNESAELAYRFIRCGELVGENVARENYFDRNEAVRLCTRISPTSGLAVLSRWRERDIGWFEKQAPVVTEELLNRGFISPLVIWSLSPFLSEYDLPEFAMACIKNEKSDNIRKRILGSAIDSMRKFDTSSAVWEKLKQFSNDLGVYHEKLEKISTLINEKPRGIIVAENMKTEHKILKIEDAEITRIFTGLDLTKSSHIDISIQRFREIPKSYAYLDSFWISFFSHVPEENIVKFLESFEKSEKMNWNNYQDALLHLPEFWKKKSSVKQNRPFFIKGIARKTARNLLNFYSRDRFAMVMHLENSESGYVSEGIIEGLTNLDNLNTAEDFFGFVTSMTAILTPLQAREVLEFSLSRLEMHIEVDFSDGKWDEWLRPPEKSSMALAGFVWSALGSPSSEIRWKAAHCVKILAENECKSEIDELFELLSSKHSFVFVCKQFPFYVLHARLYLLIAFSRISMDNSEIFEEKALKIAHYAIDDMPHILIQIFASKTALNIETCFPNTYDARTLSLLMKIGVSPFEITDIQNDQDKIQSCWHQDGAVNTKLSFYHEMDFDDYWLEPLGKVFGISKKQVEELVNMVIIEDWKVISTNGYLFDPRQNLWNSSRNEGKTWHSHGNYPSADKYGFYLSYHSMFVVAARLLERMPVVYRSKWDDENAWNSWIKSHLLSREDGFWLSDRRDGVPIREPKWMQTSKAEEWKTTITDEDFLEALLINDESNEWINVYGFWKTMQHSYCESIYIASAIVSSETSQALLRALYSCNNPHDYKLPEYQEERAEFDLGPFQLKGWVVNDTPEDGIDKLDELSGQIIYPEYRIGQKIMNILNLCADDQYRNWYIDGKKEACLVCRNWSYKTGYYDVDMQIKGLKLSGTDDILKKLCLSENCDLVIEVQIERDIIKSKYDNFNEKNNDYEPPKHKIYIFSKEGELFDENGSVRFRKTFS